MNDYTKLVKSEAKVFYEEEREAFRDDEGEFGGKSEQPNLLRWIDRTEKLAAKVGSIAEKWGPREYRWVQANTRNRAPGGGDPASNAFASLLQDVRHEIKKLARK